jgi:RNA polymerase sigma-70 factor (ECF subfamily)
MTIELAYYLGHSCEEIATIMCCPLSTVKARMFHARTKLRNALPGLAGLEETRPGAQSSASAAFR